MIQKELNMKHGVTGPTTLDSSTKDSLEKSKILINFLKENDFFESEEDAKTRERALGRLSFLLKKFVRQQSLSKGETKDCGGIICTFGSYRLGVHDKGADIDALCVVPRHISRKDFFNIFYNQLLEDSNVTELSKVEDAYVPVIKMHYMDIPIDLTMARVNLPVVDSNLDLLNDTLLKTMDEKCILSINGSRVTDSMLNLIPNKETFHMALRAIKFWAKRRYIYGNAYGYFGGVAFSISVARICQLYPNKSSYDIVCKYFEYYSNWTWPEPILLKPIVDHHYNLKVWDNQKYPADRYHKMPIITPAYPSMCSTHNVFQSTFDLICREFRRSTEIINNSINSTDFLQIFDNTDFFRKYKLYINIKVKADKESIKSWSGFVESKVRILCSKFEAVESIVAAIPFPKPFIKDETCNFFIGIEILKTGSQNKKIYVDGQIKEFIDFLNEWNGKTAIMNIEISAEKKKSMQTFFKNFFK